MPENTISEAEYNSWTPLPAALHRLAGVIGWSEAKNEISNRIVLGQMRAASRNSTWEHGNGSIEARSFEKISPTLWGLGCPIHGMDAIWKTGSMKFVEAGYHGRSLATVCFGIRLHPDDLKQVLSDVGVVAIEAQPVTATATALPPAQVKSSAGRPRKDWWDELWIEVLRRVIDGRLAEDTAPSGSKLEYELLDIANDLGFSPGESTLKPMALKLFKFLKERGGK